MWGNLIQDFFSLNPVSFPSGKQSSKLNIFLKEGVRLETAENYYYSWQSECLAWKESSLLELWQPKYLFLLRILPQIYPYVKMKIYFSLLHALNMLYHSQHHTQIYIHTVFLVEENFKAVWLIVVESLSDFFNGLLVCQFTIHKTEKKIRFLNQQHCYSRLK